ncbi:MAG TPA: bifunctional YncE family protein/alkaline phosphatase family protein [Candidatus Rubrimentiphilum sp.]|nr:bifunctional YncE family protein/alkaline phosphatase family protein [Candidatus Rubrimentiphilum sp.]
MPRPPFILVLAVALAAALPEAAPAALTIYSAPAGTRIAGASNPANPYDVILPNGRIVAPVGHSVVVGMNALGVALSPDGEYAIVTNDDERVGTATSRYSPSAHGGYSLAVVSTRSMRVTDVYSAAGTKFFLGVTAIKDPSDPSQTLVIAAGGGDNSVHFFHLRGGKLEPIVTSLKPPIPSDPRYANHGHVFPGWIALATNHRTAYVVNNLANSVTAIDLATRTALQTVPVGYFPYAAIVAGRRLYVTNPGLSIYGNLAAPARYPQFDNAGADAQHASALSVVPLSIAGDVAASALPALSLDRAPDGTQIVGGAYPSAIALSKNGRYAYICMTNVDRVAVVDLLGVPHVVGGIELRLFDRAPYGMQPNAIVRSSDGKRVYVALAGINAIAVLDSRSPSRLHRLGLIPTGWYPTGLAISSNGRYLYVTNAKGFGEEPRFEGGPPYHAGSNGHIFQAGLDSNVIWATLQRIDLRKLPMTATTLSALKYTRTPLRSSNNPLVPPLRSLQRSQFIRHIVFILEENKTYDSMLGDLTDDQGRPYGNGDPSLVSFGASITPNLDALAREFALATNLYGDSEESDAGHQYAAAGIATANVEKTLLVKSGRYPLVNKNEDPTDYPRAGYIFNNAARAGLSYRDYGDLVRLSGYDEGRNVDPRIDDPNFRDPNDQSAPTSGLGGLYSLDVTAPAVLRDHIDLNYPGWNLRIRDVRRANEYMRDFRTTPMPDFTYIWLPSDHGGAGPNIPALPEEVADGDRALGMIVDFLSHQPEWDSTAIFITPDDTQSSRDHVSEHRGYAIMVSPYARRHFTSSVHLSTVSILKTEEELLGLPPLSLGDLLATDMAEFFTTSAADATPFTAIPVPAQTESAEGATIARLLEKTDQSEADADAERSACIIDRARQADRLAARRLSMSDARYTLSQKSLYRAAARCLDE